MTPVGRRRFELLLAADGAGTAAYCVRALSRPHGRVPIVDAAGAALGWAAAGVALRRIRPASVDRAPSAARWIAAGTLATVGAAVTGASASLRAGRPAWPSLLLIATGAALGGAYLRVLAADDPG